MKLQAIIAETLVRTRRPASLRLFRTLLYAWFLAYLAYNFQVWDYVWGRNSFVMPMVAPPSLEYNLFYFLSYNGTLAHWVLLLHALACIFSLAGWGGFLPRIIVYITAAMLYFAGYLAFNGGYLLCWQFSLFLIPSAASNATGVRGVLNNLAMTGCILQFLLVYGIAAWYKWTGTSWLEGSSVYYTLRMDHFSSWNIGEWLTQSPALMLLLNYLALGYQTLFPIMVWVRPMRNIWLMTGVGFHCFIMVAMGLWDFGLAMIIGYALFLPNSEAQRVLNWLRIGGNQSSPSTKRSIV